MFQYISKHYHRLSEKQKGGLAIFAICLFAFLLLLPQLISGGSIAGSDFLFHYNRFYETAEQIKTGNFSYFISLYGFNGSARIVNALYGPYFAYLQGAILLLSKTWYTYQLVSRFLIASLAGLSMYRLLRFIPVKRRTSLAIALLFMTTFSIQYWTFRQGFNAWGAAFMPWCLITAIDFLKTGRVKIIRLAVAVAIMTQVHMLSTLMLVLMYIPFYLYGFIKSQHKLEVFLKGTAAALLCLLLTANVWLAILQVGSGNELVQPFINSKLYIMTVNQRSIEWLITPYPLVAIVLYVLYFSFRHWRHYDKLLRTATTAFFIFLVLSTSIFPWYQVNKLKLNLVNLIQFPFRFFIPTTVLLLLVLALVIERYLDVKYSKWVAATLLAVNIIGFAQISYRSTLKLWDYHNAAPIKNATHQFVLGSDSDIRKSFHSQDLSRLLSLAIKSTPDYLPAQKGNKENKYALYEYYVLSNDNHFEESQKGDKLTVTWTGDKAGRVSLPITKYKDTQLILNGQKLTEFDYTQTGIGTISVNQKVGKNTLVVSYRVSWFKYVLIGNALAWLATLATWLYTNRIKQKKQI